MTYPDLFNRLNDSPFHPFRVKLSNNTSIDVLDPGMIIVSPGSAVMPYETPYETHIDENGFRVATRWKTVAVAHMVEFVDIDPPKTSSKRRRAS